MTSPFEGLQMFGYDLIVADYPWRFETYSQTGGLEKSPEAEYETMSVDEIYRAFPVSELAARDCVYLMWVTNPMIDQQIALGQRQGFQFVSLLTWIKTTVNGKRSYGAGYVQRCATEHVAIFKTGSPVFSGHLRSCFDGIVREHSRKPEEAFTHFEQLVPSAQNRLELFSRENRPGWTPWGNETGLFNDPVRLAAWKNRRKAQKRAVRDDRRRRLASRPKQTADFGPLFEELTA